MAFESWLKPSPRPVIINLLCKSILAASRIFRYNTIAIAEPEALDPQPETLNPKQRRHISPTGLLNIKALGPKSGLHFVSAWRRCRGVRRC